LGLLWPCPQILRPDWKGFPVTNPLAYWASSSVTKEKSFITLTPGGRSRWNNSAASVTMTIAIAMTMTIAMAASESEADEADEDEQCLHSTPKLKLFEFGGKKRQDVKIPNEKSRILDYVIIPNIPFVVVCLALKLSFQ